MHTLRPYVPGQRLPFWLKVKAVKSDDFVVIGWTGEKPFEALLVGYHEDGRLLPCGTVGGGYDEPAMKTIREMLADLASDTSPLEPPPIMTSPVPWGRPQLVVSVRYPERSPAGACLFRIFNS